jgi:hypothetical protein
MTQVARNLVDPEEGFLRNATHLIHDRDPLLSRRTAQLLSPRSRVRMVHDFSDISRNEILAARQWRARGEGLELPPTSSARPQILVDVPESCRRSTDTAAWP